MSERMPDRRTSNKLKLLARNSTRSPVASSPGNCIALHQTAAAPAGRQGVGTRRSQPALRSQSRRGGVAAELAFSISATSAASLAPGSEDGCRSVPSSLVPRYARASSAQSC